MAVAARSSLSAGVAAVAAIMIVLSFTVSPSVLRVPAEHPTAWSANPTRAFAVRLLAALQQLQHASATAGSGPMASNPVTATQLPAASATKLTSLAATKIAGTPAAAGPEARTATPAAARSASAVTFGLPGLQNAIINTYNTVMPWVDWGVEVAQWAVGWVPWVGWVAADQIGIFYFHLIRPIITSGVYNTAYVIGGSAGLFPAIGNFINDTGYAINGFVQSEINWALSFLPPLPPLPFAATKAAAAKAAAAAKLSATNSKAAKDTEAATDDTKTHQDAKTSKDARAHRDAKTHTPPTSATDPQPSDNTPADNLAAGGKNTGKSDTDSTENHNSGKIHTGAGKSVKSANQSAKSGSAKGSHGHGNHNGQHGSK